MNDNNNLLLIVTYAIIILFVFIASIVAFIIKARLDRINIEKQKNEIERIANQKTLLLKEIHHRVKNNLQLVSGLLYLQSTKYKNKEIDALIEESQKHIHSIALVHEMLYQEDTLSLISMEKYIQELTTKLQQVSSNKDIQYNILIKDIELPIDYATTFGLIINELVINSLKYAFNSNKGIITIFIEEKEAGVYEFKYSDDGIGLDSTHKKENTLGQKLIKMLADEIDADLSIENQHGLTYKFNFKYSSANE